MNYQNFIKKVLQEASEIADDKFGKVTGTVKGGDSNQILTEADIAVGTHIIKKIKEEFPSYNIIDEEAGVIDNGSEFTWVIDPIDGTSNFAHGVPTYGIMLGLLKEGEAVAGGFTLPAFVKICTAEKGKGAFCNDDRLHVTEEEKLINTLVAYGIDADHRNPANTFDETKLLAELMLNATNHRTSNSVFDILMLIEGRYGGALNRTSKIWDNVAPQIVVEEAGGVYTDFFGKPIDYTNPLTKSTMNYTFCAASPALHKQLQEIIHSK